MTSVLFWKEAGEERHMLVKKMVSFVIPCYRSEKLIAGVVEDIDREMEKLKDRYSYEIILVNDSSPDRTFEVIRELCQEKTYITGVNLARNFGQHAALMMGFRKIRGEFLVCLDDDGQTPLASIGDLLQGLEDGSDVVYAKYEHKYHNAFRNFGSRINDWMLCFMMEKPKDLYITSFFAAKRFIVDEILRYQNAFPYMIGLVLRATKNIKNVTVEQPDQWAGESDYTLRELFPLWCNGFISFSEKPFRVATMVGMGCSALGFLYGVYTIIKKLVNPLVPIGFSTLMAVFVCIGGMLMLMLGLVGEYVGRMYICMNNAPQYVVREIVNDKNEK